MNDTGAHIRSFYLKLTKAEIQVMDFVLFDKFPLVVVVFWLFQKVLHPDRITYECLYFRGHIS